MRLNVSNSLSPKVVPYAKAFGNPYSALFMNSFLRSSRVYVDTSKNLIFAALLNCCFTNLFIVADICGRRAEIANSVLSIFTRLYAVEPDILLERSISPPPEESRMFLYALFVLLVSAVVSFVLNSITSVSVGTMAALV